MLSRTLKAATLAVAIAAVCAGSAQAALIDTDDVKITAPDFDLGNNIYVAGAPTGSGELYFYYENAQIEPVLNAYLHIDDSDGLCGRARLNYYDDSDLLATRYSDTKCAHDDHHHDWWVDVDGYSNRAIDRVMVTIEREDAHGWSSVQSQVHTVSPPSDPVKITTDGVDFGGADFTFGEPNQGFMLWDLDHGDLTPALYGFIHLNNSSGDCARINHRYLTEAGTFLDAVASDYFCADDNDHHAYPLEPSDFGGVTGPFAPVTSDKVGQVKVQLQMLMADGSWNVIGHKTVSVEE